ncbi:MAG: hypothetical protein NZ699_06505 [Roseiflexus sp.]|nr:hypothetical protein [Roseiflexus sp.]
MLLTIVSFVGSIVVNIATDSLPEWLRPHPWLAWSITGILLLLALALTALAQREGPDLARQRALLLRNVQAEIKRQLDNRLPERRQRIPLSLKSQPQAVLPRPGLRLEQPHRSRPIPPDTPSVLHRTAAT